VTNSLHDANGATVAFIDDDGKFVHYLNDSIAGFLDRGSFYSIGGEYLGWLERDCIFDKDGKCLYFLGK
jgi:hypothetical protein